MSLNTNDNNTANTAKSFFPKTRLRRLRHNAHIRNMIRETSLSPNDFILPLFVKFGTDDKTPISSMPGHYQLPLSALKEEIKTIEALGLHSIMLFGIPEHKDAKGKDSYSDNGIIQNAIHEIKSASNNINIISDICLCEYTDHGHCGYITDTVGFNDVDNDITLELLQKQALSHVKAGADVIAPSGMIDGMVGAIRQVLDTNNYKHIPILSYAVKYSSALYGPFREATEGAPKFGDRKTYQMDPANGLEAIRECELDLTEGADMLMVKPALSYLDVILRVKQQYPEVPLGAYHVSGEYAMIKAAAEKGWIDEKRAFLEALISIKRAGADFIINYACKDVCIWLE